MQIPEKDPAAVALGRRGKGKPKTLTTEQRQALADRMRAYHAAKRAKENEAQKLEDWQDRSKQYQPV